MVVAPVGGAILRIAIDPMTNPAGEAIEVHRDIFLLRFCRVEKFTLNHIDMV